MSLFLPFNFKPDSTTVRTGEYTIPVGRYAFVYDNSSTLSIDSNYVGYTEPVEVYSNVSTATVNNTLIYTATKDIDLTISYSYDGASIGSLRLASGNKIKSKVGNHDGDPLQAQRYIDLLGSSTGATYDAINISLREGRELYLTQSLGPTSFDFKIYEETIKGSDQIWIPVNEGTVLNGQNYTVVEYIIP